CPVEDTGRNSVKPSTTPRMNALKRSKDMGGSVARAGDTSRRPVPRGESSNRPSAFPATSTRGQPPRPNIAQVARGLFGFSNRPVSSIRRCQGPPGTNSATPMELERRIRYQRRMVTLFHHPFCPHSRFVRLALGEYGLEARLIEERAWE